MSVRPEFFAAAADANGAHGGAGRNAVTCMERGPMASMYQDWRISPLQYL